MKKRLVLLYLLLLPAVFSWAQSRKGGGFNLFSLQQDIDLGKQVSAEIENNPAQYPLLPETGRNGNNEQAYSYLRTIVDRILSSGKVTYRNEFPWRIKIIQDDNTLNAFCVPGGYIYVYTGLIKYLDTEDQLAGVLGHEIAHADKRHSTRAMTKQYGQQVVIDVVLGKNQGVLTQMAQGLLSLNYSRDHEREADAFSVEYLCGTQYRSDGAAGFFQKMLEGQQGGKTPAFLSTHPNPQNRVQDITKRAQAGKCNLNNFAGARYAYFKSLLP
jgi:beta-barrel assembly-enhancing protease